MKIEKQSGWPIDSAYFIYSLIRSRPDLLRLRDLLMEEINRNHCCSWNKRAWQKLFTAVGTWDSEPIDLNVFEKPYEEITTVAHNIGASEQKVCKCFVEIFTFLRALRYTAVRLHQEQMVERQ